MVSFIEIVFIQSDKIGAIAQIIKRYEIKRNIDITVDTVDDFDFITHSYF